MSLGLQSLDRIREHNAIYVDRTHIASMLMYGDFGRVAVKELVLFIRPRRFGKTLFLSTLKALAKRDLKLLKDTAFIQNMPRGEEDFIVLQFDLKLLDTIKKLNSQFRQYAFEFNVLDDVEREQKSYYGTTQTKEMNDLHSFIFLVRSLHRKLKNNV